MPSKRTTILLCALLLALAPRAAAQAPTAAALHAEVTALTDGTARQWLGLMTPDGDFANPFPANLAAGHGGFVPPMLAYAVHRAGERTGDEALVEAAERAWPRSVNPARASAFDMVGAAYAYRSLSLSDERRAQLAGYMGAYGIPLNGHSCISRPGCYSNLRLVDALAILAITGAGVSSPDPAARLGNPVAARAAAARLVNHRIPHVVDHGLRARIGHHGLRGTVLSDPPQDPLAYHALSTFMLGEAIAQLGPGASRGARRAWRRALNALAVLVSPDGDASYMGRGQGQTWVPALVAGAMARGARQIAPRNPVRAGGYLAVAGRAVQRLAALHAGPQGFRLVPDAATRATVAGIDRYAHAVAYNGVTLFGLTAALDALAAIPTVPIGAPPADSPLAVRDERASGLGVLSDGRTWLAVHARATSTRDLRYDFGPLALKRLTAAGWVDQLAPRPLTLLPSAGAGPALIHRDRRVRPQGSAIRTRRRSLTVAGVYHLPGVLIRHVRFRWTLTRRGVRLRVSGARPGDRFRMLAFTPAGTGGRAPRVLFAAGARWAFDRPIRGRRIRGFHSGPIERLDALEARLTAPKSGRFTVTIGS